MVSDLNPEVGQGLWSLHCFVVFDTVQIQFELIASHRMKRNKFFLCIKELTLSGPANVIEIPTKMGEGHS